VGNYISVCAGGESFLHCGLCLDRREGSDLISTEPGAARRSTVADLPSIIPLFPLPNLVLFPGVSVPLHIFEPRYREMVAEVASDHRTIGMILLKGDWEREYYAQPDVFSVGCAGRIGGLLKLPDGRYNMVLEGFSEFRVIREVRGRSYRQAEVQWIPTPPSALRLDQEMMDGLREMLVSYVGEVAAQAWQSLVVERGLSGAQLVNFICFQLDITPLEKQTLLEAGADRLNCLFDILTFRLEERKAGGSGGIQ
jgi:Lon protease-like protein